MLFKAVVLHCHDRIKIDLRQVCKRRVAGICLHLCNLVLQVLLLECVTIHQVAQNSHHTAAQNPGGYDQQNDPHQQFFSIRMTHLTVYSI